MYDWMNNFKGLRQNKSNAFANSIHKLVEIYDTYINSRLFPMGVGKKIFNASTALNIFQTFANFFAALL